MERPDKKRRFKLTLEYDGTDFSGWQNQPEGRTVQGVVEGAFSIFCQENIKVYGQGRTDAGVHARAQTAHVDIPASQEAEPYRILHAMRGLLPRDVALKNIEPVSTGFHARFDARYRTYSYRLMEIPSPLNRRTTWIHYRPVQEEVLFRCASAVLGEHDFVNFCIPGGGEDATTICTITESEWHKSGDLWTYRITGNRFLRHMVRRLAGTMVQVSDGTRLQADFDKLLYRPGQTEKGHSAPPCGLILERVTY